MKPVEMRALRTSRGTNTALPFLLLEMAIAIAVSAYSLYMTFNGLGGFPGKH